MKTYVIILSQVFPATHSRAGEPTRFRSEFLWGQQCGKCQPRNRDRNYAECDSCLTGNLPKIHTIRANYPLWRDRIEEVQDGRAVLSVRQWTGKPYRSKQVEIAPLSAGDGVGIQKLTFCGSLCRFLIDDNTANQYIYQLPNNDGLTVSDWEEWFRRYDLTQPMAIIHFTKFRY